jgi:Protein of unknown function (DUF3102)
MTKGERMNKHVTISKDRKIARPLKTLIPLIQGELQMGDEAGREHYEEAGHLLIEAKDQVPYGRWGSWLTKHFDLTHRTANLYMQWARHREEIRTGDSKVEYDSMRHMRGAREQQREDRGSVQQQAFRRVLRDVARDTFVQERQTRDDEIKLHRDLAEELIDIGYRALATRLHPDRGGSKDAMARLNRVRDELKSIAETRRFV